MASTAPTIIGDDAKEKISSEQGHPGSVDTKVLEDLEAVPGLNKLDKTNNDDPTTADVNAPDAHHWLTGRRLLIVHSAMLLSYVFLKTPINGRIKSKPAIADDRPISYVCGFVPCLFVQCAAHCA